MPKKYWDGAYECVGIQMPLKLNAKGAFYLYLMAHVIIWTLVPTLDRHCQHHDMLEGITQGLQYQWGYIKHPFLSMWLMADVYRLASHHDWVIYLFAQGLMCICFYYIWQLGRCFLPNGLALIATILPQGLLFYNQESFNINPDSFQLPFWAAITYYFYQVLTTNKTRDWLILGMLSGLSFLIKYQFILLLIPMLVFCLWHEKTRRTFKNHRFYLSIGLAFLIVLPHFLWLVAHDFINISYALNVAKSYPCDAKTPGFIEYLVNSTILLVLVFALYIPFYLSKKQSLTVGVFQKHFILFSAFGPWFTTWVVTIVSGDHMVSRLMTPYFSFIGLWIVSMWSPILNKPAVVGFLLLVTLEILTLVAIPYLPIHQNSSSDAYLPNPEIAQYLEKIWVHQSSQPLQYIGGSRYLIASVVPYFHVPPKPFFSLSLISSPWIDVDDLKKQGAIFIWDIQKQYSWDIESQSGAMVPNDFYERFPMANPGVHKTFYRLNKAHQPVVITIAVLPPQR